MGMETAIVAPVACEVIAGLLVIALAWFAWRQMQRADRAEDLADGREKALLRCISKLHQAKEAVKAYGVCPECGNLIECTSRDGQTCSLGECRFCGHLCADDSAVDPVKIVHGLVDTVNQLSKHVIRKENEDHADAR